MPSRTIGGTTIHVTSKGRLVGPFDEPRANIDRVLKRLEHQVAPVSDTHDEALRWESWLHAYEQARDELPGPITRRCPNCGRACLRLVYRLRIPHLLIGEAHFWCDHCLRGPYLGRVESPKPPRRLRASRSISG